MATNKPRTVRITELSQRAVPTAPNQQSVTEATPTDPAATDSEARGTYINAYGREINEAEDTPRTAFGRPITESKPTTAFGRDIKEN